MKFLAFEMLLTTAQSANHELSAIFSVTLSSLRITQRAYNGQSSKKRTFIPVFYIGRRCVLIPETIQCGGLAPRFGCGRSMRA